MFIVALGAVVGVLAVWLILRLCLREASADDIAAPPEQRQAA
jgi:hypothetical protein